MHEKHNRECNKLKGFRCDSEFEEKVTLENRKKLLNNDVKNITIETERFVISKNNQIVKKMKKALGISERKKNFKKN